MKCYYHPDFNAIGICKNCHRGLCAHCVVEVENGLACRNRCEEAAAMLNVLIQKSTTAYDANERMCYWFGVILQVLAAPILILGLLAAIPNPLEGGLFFLMGSMLLLLGMLMLRISRRLKSRKQRPPQAAGNLDSEPQ